MFIFGSGLITISIFLMPYIVIVPHKVSMLINLGSLCILGSFGFLKGFYNYFVADLLLGPRKLYFLGYLCSSLLSLYASLIAKSYIFTLFTLIIEVIFLLYFICASFPGGRTGLSYIFSMFRGLFTKCCKKVLHL